MAKKKFYVTTPIYYTNGPPHIGSAYTTIAADVLARWHKLLGEDVFFLTGTDEHGQKIQEIAEQNRQKPKEFVDKIVREFKEAFKMLNISNDNFIRTTDTSHEKEVKDLLNILFKKKLIYKGFYESYYCVGCEQYLTQSDLVDGKCPLHNRIPELKKEEAYLFRLSACQDKLLELIKSGEYCILPKDRKKEIITFIESGLQDVSISRLKEKISWGIELPFDQKHTVWVWPDAFWNYVSGLRGTGKANFKKFWPANVQLMAKDIIRVHATIWPALLLGAGYKLPKTLFVHGYFTINGQKMSKSLGNVISPIYLTQKYGADCVRYYLMRNIPFGSDGDVSEQALVDRYNNELADKLGNLVSRVSTLIEKYGMKKCRNSLLKMLELDEIKKHFENYEIDRALNEIFAFIDVCNEYVQNEKPWTNGDKEVLYELADSIKVISILLWPYVPSSAEKIAKQFGFKIKNGSIKDIKKALKVVKVKKGEILFRKIDFKAEENMNINKSEEELFVVKESKINGKGLFANRNFKKGEQVIPWNKEAKYLSEDELKKLPNELKKYVAFFDNKYLLIASPERYLNHSCNPNVETRDNGIEYAMRDIKKGEELTGDYTQVKTLIGFECKCGGKNCKKIIQSMDKKINKVENIEGIMNLASVHYGDWEKLDLRVAQIKSAEDIEGADKLFKLELDVGKEIGKRTICAGIKGFYKKDELKGKKIIYFSNLAPRMMRGIESQGMLLAAVTKDHGKVVLISPEKDIEVGARIS